MTQLSDLLDVAELDAEAQAGYVSVRPHPDFFNLKIANYTDKCAFDRHWTPLTRMTRGLIYDDNNFEVLARPFEKFFNWDEKEAPRILDDQVVWHWADKADGSLGILYNRPDGQPAIATRGSFASEQAALGTKILHASGKAWVWAEYIDAGYTPLFEICGPDNRIVLRYETNFLQPLGFIHIETGQFVPPEGKYEPRTMRDLLGDLSRQNAEGWVVWLSTYKALKIKQADYIELHRMVSNLTPKEVWRQLRSDTYMHYVQQLPDELYDLAESWALPLMDEFQEIYAQAVIDRDTVKTFRECRKDQARWIMDYVPADRRGLVFALLDGKDITDPIWRLLEPRGTVHTDGSAT